MSKKLLRIWLMLCIAYALSVAIHHPAHASSCVSDLALVWGRWAGWMR